MGNHQTADTGMGLHGTALRQADTNLFHIDLLIKHEVQTGIRQRGITHSWTDALKLFDKHLRNRQLLILGITPNILSYLLMHPFCCCLSQTVSQQLCHHFLIRIGIKIGFETVGNGSGEDAEF